MTAQRLTLEPAVLTNAPVCSPPFQCLNSLFPSTYPHEIKWWDSFFLTCEPESKVILHRLFSFWRKDSSVVSRRKLWQDLPHRSMKGGGVDIVCANKMMKHVLLSDYKLQVPGPLGIKPFHPDNANQYPFPLLKLARLAPSLMLLSTTLMYSVLTSWMIVLFGSQYSSNSSLSCYPSRC